MLDFSTGARRPVTDGARAKRLTAAQDLVQPTLAQHGLASSASPSSPPDTQGLMSLLQRVLPKGNGTTTPRPTPGSTPRPVDIPYGARFLSGIHQGKSGKRAYRTYVPASAIVMMLHGCTQTSEDFAIGTGMNALAEREGFIVIYPEQSRGANAQTCWNWFSPNDQHRDRGEPEILAGIARTAMAQYDVPSERTFVAGLSAGAAMVVILGYAYPDVFAAVGARSGLPYKAARDIASAFASIAGQRPCQAAEPPLPGIRTIVFHGSADSTVHVSNSESIARSAKLHLPSPSLQTTRKTRAGGRSYTATICTSPDGRNHLKYWVIDGLGHAWSGGRPGSSYTNPRGPNASVEMTRFFFECKD
jgi:poly(hydroxyalkanoate) depolymerase family esterase